MKEIKLSRGYVTIVDDEDFDWLSQWNWHCTRDGYAARRTPRTQDRNQGLAFMLGYFLTPEEAGRAHDMAAIKLHKEFASLNFPRETYDQV